MENPNPNTLFETPQLVHTFQNTLPLTEYEDAIGWNDWSSPLKVQDNTVVCSGCDYSSSFSPDEPERYTHHKKCATYREWRMARWQKFNESVIGKLLASQFRMHWHEYYQLQFTPESSRFSIGQLMGNYVNTGKDNANVHNANVENSAASSLVHVEKLP